MLPRIAACYCVLIPAILGTHLEKYGPWQHIRTQPTFQAAILNVSRPHTGRVSASTDLSIITTLRTFDGHGPWGPQIFKSTGELVFYSDANNIGLGIQDPHVCPFGLEEDARYLCASEALTQSRGHLEVTPRVYDATYRQISPEQRAPGILGHADGHEFRMLGETYITTIYVPKPFDLGELSHGKDFVDAHVYDACFQEVHSLTGETVFVWCYLDHADIKETVLDLNDPAFVQYPPSRAHPFDFAHINSVDKTSDGNYLVSMKFLSQILLISGPINKNRTLPGQILWRLGGNSSDFMMSADVHFEYQHHARLLSSNDSSVNITILSVFDNHCADHSLTTCQIPSAGKLIQLNETDGKASILGKFVHPSEGTAWAGGSIDILCNGNVFVTWGQIAEVSEFHRATGDLLMHTVLDPSGLTFQYRSSYAKWSGYPQWRPKILIYSGRCGDAACKDRDGAVKYGTRDKALNFYLSWNGATEVRYWHILSSVTGDRGTYINLGFFAREDFETHVQMPCDEKMTDDPQSICSAVYFKAVALGIDGSPLQYGETLATQVFTPDSRLLKDGTCGDISCGPGFSYEAIQAENVLCGPHWLCQHLRHSVVLKLSFEILIALTMLVMGVFYYRGH